MKRAIILCVVVFVAGLGCQSLARLVVRHGTATTGSAVGAVVGGPPAAAAGGLVGSLVGDALSKDMAEQEALDSLPPEIRARLLTLQEENTYLSRLWERVKLWGLVAIIVALFLRPPQDWVKALARRYRSTT